MVDRSGNRRLGSQVLYSQNSSIDLGFEHKEFNEDEQDADEDFNSSMMEFNNNQPHELERCKAVSKIGLKVEGKRKETQLKKVLSYVDYE